jgi:NADPH:quinone reductase-like Zn-dependent oxidoreductase
VDLAQAAALPVAGVAALRVLRASGAVLGRRVLITGASGGVGRFAVRLAPTPPTHSARRVNGKAVLDVA